MVRDERLERQGRGASAARSVGWFRWPAGRGTPNATSAWSGKAGRLGGPQRREGPAADKPTEPYTSASHSAYSSTLPYATSKKRSCKARVTGPGLPITRPSTLPMGVSSAASGHEHLVGNVEVGAREAFLDGGDLQVIARHSTESRVMPSSRPSESGGVDRMPSRTTNKFSPVPSHTRPFSFSMMASA